MLTEAGADERLYVLRQPIVDPFRDDERLDHLAPHRVRHAYDSGLAHGGMVQQRVLSLGRAAGL